MTIQGPDLSNNNGSVTILSGTAFVFAKCSENNNYKDPYYAGFKTQAAKVGAVFSAYHFLHQGNGAGQASYCHSIIGSTPLMMDVETTDSSKPTITDVCNFVDEHRKLGGVVWGVYLPHWYWQNLGSPSLQPLIDRKLALVSSSYPTAGYSDNGPGWASYGGMTPTVWQWTDSKSYSGKSVDFNAYKGTKDQLASLLSGGTSSASNGSTTVSVEEDDDMQQIESLAVKADGSYAYAFGRGAKKEVAFVFDGFGQKAALRVVEWNMSGPVVHTVTVGSPDGHNHSTVIAFGTPADVYAVTVTRTDSLPGAIGVCLVNV